MRVREGLVPLREPSGGARDSEKYSEHVGRDADRAEHDACHVDGFVI